MSLGTSDVEFSSGDEDDNAGIITLAIMEYCDKTVEVVALHQHPQVVMAVGEILVEQEE